MINLWRMSNRLLMLVYTARSHNKDVFSKKWVVGFRRWLKVERMKAVVGIPLAYLAFWHLVIDPAPGRSLSEMIGAWYRLPMLHWLFTAPLILISIILIIAALGYTIFGVISVVGWLQIRYFGYPR